MPLYVVESCLGSQQKGEAQSWGRCWNEKGFDQEGGSSSAPKDFLRLCSLPQGHLEGAVREVCSAPLWASCFLDVSCIPGHLGLPLMPCPEHFTPWPHIYGWWMPTDVPDALGWFEQRQWGRWSGAKLRLSSLLSIKKMPHVLSDPVFVFRSAHLLAVWEHDALFWTFPPPCPPTAPPVPSWTWHCPAWEAAAKPAGEPGGRLLVTGTVPGAPGGHSAVWAPTVGKHYFSPTELSWHSSEKWALSVKVCFCNFSPLWFIYLPFYP